MPPPALPSPLLAAALALATPLVAAASHQAGPQTPQMPVPPLHLQDDGAATSNGRRLAYEKEERYEILPSAGILERMQKLVADYPTFATLTTTQEWFGLPRAGSDADCSFDSTYKVSGKGCNNYVLILQDKEAYPEDPDVQLSDDAEYYLNQEEGWFKEGEGKSGWKYVPDVFLSGAVHGNERVGPSSLLEMAELLAEAAYCESLPRMRYRPSDATTSDGEEKTKWEQELAAAKMCRQSLESDKGIPSHQRKWLARLVATRRTVIIPTANALGYSRDQREEDGIDPNRDFPFDVEHAADCMQTTAGRSINELFRSHLFPIGLTFHGGMEVIGYEWGAPTYLNKDAPDFVAQNAIAGAYSRYAGGFPGHVQYDFGTMNDKVYYVRGGMEDWAFAGSWDPDRVIECEPNTFGGYPAEKTRYNNATLRAFNMLVETSSPKAPARNELGKRSDPLLSGGGDRNGHIARNIRLALLGIDVVEPYVAIRGVGGLELEDDVVPGVNLRQYNGGAHFENSMILLVSGAQRTISWTVGGAFDIDATELIVGPWDALPLDLADAKDGTYPSQEMVDSINGLEEFVVMSPSNVEEKHGSAMGRSRWHAEGAHPEPSEAAIDPSFEATIDTSNYPPKTVLVVLARAKVDKGWLEPAKNVGPQGLGPVSHIVNARRNPSYFATNGGKVIRGKQDDWWYSAPVTVIVGAAEMEADLLAEAQSNSAPIENDDDGRVSAVHINARRGYLSGIMSTVSRPQPRNRSVNRRYAPTEKSIPWLLGTCGVALIIVLVVVLLVRRRRRRYAHRKRVERMVEEEEDVFTIGSAYHDDPEDDAEAGGYADEEGEIEIS